MICAAPSMHCEDTLSRCNVVLGLSPTDHGRMICDLRLRVAYRPEAATER